MTLRDSLQSTLEKRLAEGLIALGLAVLTGVVLLADYILPSELIEKLGTTLSAQVLLALLLVIGCLVAWIVYLQRSKPALNIAIVEPEKPKATEREFIPEIGLWKDKQTGLCYCQVCEKPVQNVEAGWYCATCHRLYKSPEFIAKEKARQANATISRHNSGGGTGWMKW